MSEKIGMTRVKTTKFYLLVFTAVLMIGYIVIALIDILLGFRFPASSFIMTGLAASYTSNKFLKYEGRNPRRIERKSLINLSFLITFVINALIITVVMVSTSASDEIYIFLKAFPDVSGYVFVVAFIFVMLISAGLAYLLIRLGYKKDKSETSKKSEFEIMSEQAEVSEIDDKTNSNTSTAFKPATSMPATLEQNSWEPPKADEQGYGVKAERAPIARWALSAIFLLVIIAGAIWLATKVIVPNDVPKKIEVSSSEKVDENTPKPVKKSSDEEAWIRALEKDTLEGYREYLTLFPEGKFKEDAQKEINAYDNKAWATAEQRDTLSGYEDYLEAWPEGLHASKARERIAEIKAKAEAIAKDAAERAALDKTHWETAARANTIDSYGRYLTQQPTGQYVDEAQKRIEAIKAEQASAAASAADTAAWNAAKSANRVDSYQQYMTSYPQGTYVPQAIAAIEQLKPAPGRVFQDCDVCPSMVSVPSGNANLGAGDNEADARPNEKPQRPVTISNLFAMGVTEVTFNEYNACVSAGGCSGQPSDNGWGQGRRPVINVSWNEAQKYVSWLSSKSGFSYSLPSEAEWEYAARGGETGVFAGGSTQALCAFANGAGVESGLRWGNNDCSDPSSDRTLPAGTLSKNKFGLKDMIGNVAEWTQDCNTLNLRDAPTDGRADERGSCNQRAVRGGSWFSGPADLRYAARLMQRRGDSNDFTGFRVVRKIAN